jgi:predicted PurR-regulated permease PerM
LLLIVSANQMSENATVDREREPTPAEPPGDAPSLIAGPIDVRSVGITVIAVAALIVMLRYAQEVIVPFVVSGMLFYALDPPVRWLQRLYVPRALGAGIVLIGLVSGLGLGAWAVQPQVSAVIAELPEAARRMRALIRPAPGESGTLTKMQEAAKEIDKAAAEASGGPAPAAEGVTRVQIQEPAFRASDYLWWGSIGILGVISQVVMILFLTYFLLLTSDLLKRRLVKHAASTLARRRITVKILDDIAQQIQRFLLVQIVTSALVAVVTGVVLWQIGLEQPAFWGVVAGVFNSIPYFGPLIVTVALTSAAIVQFGTFGMALLVASTALIITTLEGWLLTPHLLSRASKTNHVAIFAALLFWTWMWGVIGLLLAVPMLVVIKAFADHIESLQPLSDLMSE